MAFELDTDTIERQRFRGIRITVAGVGGFGCSALDALVGARSGFDAVAFSDSQEELLGSKAPVGIRLEPPPHLRAPHANRRCQDSIGEEERATIARQLHGSDMVVVAAGTDSEAGAYLAQAVAGTARDIGIFTIAVAATPFGCEGRGRMRAAEQAVAGFANHADALIVVDSETVLDGAACGASVVEAFELVEEHVARIIGSLVALFTRRGHINISFADFAELFSREGEAAAATASASGPESALNAVRDALEALIAGRRPLHEAKGLLVAVTGHTTMRDLSAAMSLIEARAGKGTPVVNGYIDEGGEGGRAAVVILAAGLERTEQLSAEREIDEEGHEADYRIPAYIRKRVAIGARAEEADGRHHRQWNDCIDKHAPDQPAYLRRQPRG